MTAVVAVAAAGFVLGVGAWSWHEGNRPEYDTAQRTLFRVSALIILGLGIALVYGAR